MSNEVANFFWHGKFTRLEKASVKSFINHGFDVNLWSFNGLKVEGARSRDARDILPTEYLTKFKMVNIFRNRVFDNQSSFTAFSDLFRMKVLIPDGGWYFDCDSLCLKDQSVFYKLRLNKQFVICDEYYNPGRENRIYNSAFYSSGLHAQNLYDRAIQICEEQDFLEWGDIGPKLFGDYVDQNDLRKYVLKPFVFHPIWHSILDLLYDPQKVDIAMEKTKKSLISHVFNGDLSNRGIDKNNPPSGSYLEKMYAEIGV